MSKMPYFNNKFSKSPSAGGPPPQRPIYSRFGDLKLRDLPKLCFFKQIMTKSDFKNQLRCHFSDVIVITSPN